MQKQLQTHLTEKIIPFWQQLLDPEWGGFYGHIDAKWLTIRKDANKGLVQQARYLFSFSRMQRFDFNHDYTKEISSAYTFIVKHFLDNKQGGYYWLCDYQGDVMDHRKVTYGLGFVIYAFSEYYQLTKDETVLKRAMDLFNLIEHYAHHPITHGYLEEFDADWNMLNCYLLADGINQTVYTLNTTLHLLEAYVNLFKASHYPLVADRITSLLQFIYNHLYDQKNSLYGYLDESLQPLTSMVSFGHNIEASWLMDEALKCIGLQNSRIETMIERLTVSTFQNGFNGLYLNNHADCNQTDRTMIWWVQSEAMVGFYNHYQKTHQNDYLKAVETIWEQIQSFMVDPRETGEWFWSVDETGKPNTDRGMGELWKTPYHNTRALIELIERMKLNEHPSPVFSDETETRTTSQPQKQPL